MHEIFSQTYPFKLPPLPYAYNALEPYIDEETMHYHHDKHFQAYINNLNQALKPYAWLHCVPLEQLLRMKDSLPESASTAILNNGGGVYNHAIFFSVLAPADEDVHTPKGEFLKCIEHCFGTFEEFKQEFNKSALSVFGSGWTYLVSDKGGFLKIKNLKNQDTLLCENEEPVFLFDVWEHAYYLKYKNARADYVKNLWNLIKLS